MQFREAALFASKAKINVLLKSFFWTEWLRRSLLRSEKCFQNKMLKKLYLQANDLEETIKRIQTHKGVLGMMIVNNDGKY